MPKSVELIYVVILNCWNYLSCIIFGSIKLTVKVFKIEILPNLKLKKSSNVVLKFESDIFGCFDLQE